jgi:hypothetical protein
MSRKLVGETMIPICTPPNFEPVLANRLPAGSAASASWHNSRLEKGIPSPQHTSLQRMSGGASASQPRPPSGLTSAT